MTQTPRKDTLNETKRDRKYILWIAKIEDYDLHRATRQVPAVGKSCTSILQENWDSSGKPAPEPGDRILDHRSDSEGQGWYRNGDWVIDRVESYPANIPGWQEFSEILICTCKYDPIDAEWQACDKGIVSLDSFGGDREAFESWLESDAAKSGKYRIEQPKALA